MPSHREQIAFDSILMGPAAANQKQVLEILATEVEKASGMASKTLLRRMKKNEETAPSGIGGGVALPHLQMDGLEKPVSVFMTLEKPVEFDGVDDVPVDVVCFLVSPTKDGTHHLRRLSRFSRLLRDAKFCRMIRTINDNDELQSLFINSQREMLIAA